MNSDFAKHEAEALEADRIKRESFKGFRNEKPEVMFEKGAKFFKGANGTVMFSYKSSAVSEFTSKATEEQKAAWPKEWMAYVRTSARKG